MLLPSHNAMSELKLIFNEYFNTKFQHQTIWQDLMNRGGTNTKDKIKIYSFYTKS